MRIIFSLLLFTTFAIRPVMEISTVMYYQLNIDYIVEKYCVNKERPKLNCNGKCYLMNQMRGNKSPSTKKSESIIIAEAFIPLFFQDNSITLNTNNLFVSTTSQYWNVRSLYPKEITYEIDHPPKV
ncbi:hypothetical protein J8281_14520 [Aquimarina sp. U1-2]|uniref:hypothetical protein n=1 Tax=Aquimarina sp. U1-2 TaxID=2823141 RepID=UPI001AECC780|nr:hypothetical protein [Aquimarina sp. U1-2]MBP2833406.1 hypothetical protein [Aquimarina sp. U1-2]